MDRNMSEDVSYSIIVKSLSARRAWIEMLTDDVSTGGKIKSLSARRAWIEIQAILVKVVDLPVALRKESVDRNCQSCCSCPDC